MNSDSMNGAPAKRPYASATLLAVAPFLIGCAVAALVSAGYFSELERKTIFTLQKWLIAAFILNSSVIFFGTFVWGIVEFVHGSDSSRGFLRTAIVLFGMLAILVCGAEAAYWIGFITGDCSVSATCRKALNERLHSSELLTCGIFASFLVIDALGYLSVRIQETGQPEEEHKRSFYARCIWIIDVPVLTIMCSVIWLRGSIFSEPGQITVRGAELLKITATSMRLDAPPLSTYGEMIGDSFAVGAILGHILLSQLAFTYLKWEYYVCPRPTTSS